MARVWRFRDNVNTDEIIPARFNITIIEKELAAKAFCEVRPDFAAGVKEGDVIVAGKNFGCGSSREHAVIALKGTGIKCILARSYARIFFRNAINIGLPILECDTSSISEGDEIDVDLKTGKIVVPGIVLQARPLPGFVQKIVRAGGLARYLSEGGDYS